MKIIITQRLTLRPWHIPDTEAFFKYTALPDVGLQTGWVPHENIEESREIIHTKFDNGTTWTITLKSTDGAFGCIGYYILANNNIEIGTNNTKIGNWTGHPYWNQGNWTKSLLTIVDYCMRVNLFQNLWRNHFVDAHAPGIVMRNCGLLDLGKASHCSHL